MKREIKKLRAALKQPVELSATEIAQGFSHYLAKKKPYTLLDKPSKGSKKLTHIAHFTLSNAGDILLPVVVRDLISLSDGDISWKKQHVHEVVSSKHVSQLNKRNGIIIGGGGLFISDTNKNTLSGWQWSCSVSALNALSVPLALYSVGYNQFRGQDGFKPVFQEHVRLLTEKASYIGLRNQGSISAFRKHLPGNLKDKVRFQPCLTTVLSKIYPELISSIKPEGFIAVNCAFDRSKNRYGAEIGNKLGQVATSIKELSKKHKIKYYVHTPTDKYFLPFMDALEIEYEIVELYNVSAHRVVEAYTSPILVMGMRGHAQLIPFGCKTPILSLITHNKLKYFLDDLGTPEWGVDLAQSSFSDEIISKARSIIKDEDAIRNLMDEKQKQLFRISTQNISDYINQLV